MTDLSIEACHNYWQSINDSDVYRALVALESVESWTLDGDADIEEALKELTRQFKPIKDISDDFKKKVVDVCVFLKSTRILKILQTLDNLRSSTAYEIIKYAEQHVDNDENCRLFVNRNIAFERFRLLRSVLSTERLQLISRAMGIMNEDM